MLHGKLTGLQTLDHPVFLVLELIGNDVCSSHHDFDHFTTPEDFEKNIVEILQYLDTILPAGSHVLTIGLAQGSALWDYMHAQTHPVGMARFFFFGLTQIRNNLRQCLWLFELHVL